MFIFFSHVELFLLNKLQNVIYRIHAIIKIIFYMHENLISILILEIFEHKPVFFFSVLLVVSHSRTIIILLSECKKYQNYSIWVLCFKCACWKTLQKRIGIKPSKFD